jgi:hypothetical protein
MKRRIVKRKSKRQEISMVSMGGPLSPGLLTGDPALKVGPVKQSRKKIAQPSDFGQTFEIGDSGETIPSEPYSGKVEKRIRLDQIDIDKINESRKKQGKQPIDAEAAKSSISEVSGSMEDLTGKVDETSIIEQVGEPRRPTPPLPHRYARKEELRQELPTSLTQKSRGAVDRLIAWDKKRRDTIEETEGGEERLPRVAGWTGRTRAEIIADEAQNVDIVNKEREASFKDEELYNDYKKRVIDLKRDMSNLRVERDAKGTTPARQQQIITEIAEKTKTLNELTAEETRAEQQMRLAKSRVTESERNLGMIRGEKASWQRYKTLGEKKWREDYSRYARVTKDLYQRSKGLQEMGGTVGGSSIGDNLTKILASPTPGAKKIGDNWRDMFGGGVGYREGRTVTDVVGYGGSPTGWTQMFGKVTSVSGNRMAGIIQPIASRQGAPALQFSMTTPVRRIGIGDISAAGIPTVRADVVTTQASPQSMVQSHYSQVQGTPSWQKARKVLRKKKGVVYGGATIRGSIHLEMGKSVVGISPKAFASGIAPMGSAKLIANPVGMPKMYGPSTPKVSLTGIDIGKASVGINPGAMKQFTVKQCDAMIRSVKKTKKKKGGG